MALRDLVADRFPLIIVDEFQDTDNSQWRVIRALAEATNVSCLADPDQRIFEYRDEINPQRLDMLREELEITEFSLGRENLRSPNSGILEFADAVLKNQSPLPETSDVNLRSYWPNSFEACVHAYVIWTVEYLEEEGN